MAQQPVEAQASRVRQPAGPPYWAPPLDILKAVLTIAGLIPLLFVWLTSRPDARAVPSPAVTAAPVLQTAAPLATAAPIAVAPLINEPAAGVTLDPTNLGNLSGTAAPNATVLIFDGANQIGEAVADANGRWTFALPSLGAGAHSFTARVMAADGQMVTSPPLDVTIAAPELALQPPTINLPATGITLTVGNLGEIGGSAAPNSTVLIFDGQTQIGEAVAGSDGKWTFTLPDLAAGLHVLMAKVVGADGKEVMSPTVPVTVAEGVAASPNMTFPLPLPAIGLTTPGISLTLGNLGVLTGTGAPNSTVLVFNGDEQIGEAVVGPDGQWTFPWPNLPAGVYALRLKATNPDGTTSESPVIPVTIEDSAGATAAITATNGATVTAGVIPSIVTPPGGFSIDANRGGSISGAATPGEQVEIFANGASLGTATADNAGQWNFDIPALKGGDYVITVKSGSGTSPEVNVTVTDAKLPTVVVPSSGFSIDPNKGGSISGAAAPGETVDIIVNGKSLGAATADKDGKWNFDLPASALTGDSIEVSAKTAAGASSPVEIAIAKPLAAPVITLPKSGGDVSSSRPVQIRGTAAPNSTVEVFADGVKLGEVKADRRGNWRFTSREPLKLGEVILTARVVDASGAQSAASDEVRIVYGATPLLPTTGADLGADLSE